MNVLVLTPYLPGTAPAMRFRMEQWAPYLEKEGVRLTFVPFETQALHNVLYQRGHYGAKAVHTLGALFRRLLVLVRVRRYDVIFLHREAALLGPALIERLMAWTGIPVVYDFDDPIWLAYRSPTNHVFSFLKCPGKTASICRLARVTTVGNRLLAEWARQHARKTQIVPSTIETDDYPVKANRPLNGPVTLAWTGSHSTLPFLDSLRPVLARLSEKCAFRLLVISHTDAFHMDGARFEVVSRKWKAETEAADLLDADIGLAPFPDSGWTPWRCHGKVLQYMAVGIPTVASHLGILPDYIRDGEEGFLVTTEDEWVSKLVHLIEDTGLRREMGLKSRQLIEDSYSARAWAPRVAEILRSAQQAPEAVYQSTN
jgi:glycosyltransferase involved in cell wall biosynthesis